jgi:hypothetical protein
MNGRRPPMNMPMQPDRRPQELARMLAMQERNSSLNGPTMQQPVQPSLGMEGGTPNAMPGVAPQAMNFNGPQMQQYRQLISNAALSQAQPIQQSGPEMAPQIGGMQRRRPPMGAGARGYPSSPGMTTPQGGRNRGDFDGY